MSIEQGLTVYRASAGSGKTYTLTLEYLKQVLRSEHSVTLFRSVLAVTFTNKATEEMKSRILSSLNDLAEGKDAALSKVLQKELQLEEKNLQYRARKVRTAILHDYSRFAVSTIDTFFQKIIHSFIREAGLRPGFRLETDQDKILDEAIDQLLLSTHEKPAIYNQILGMIDEQMESGSTWDIRGMLKEKAGLIFKEDFRALGDSFYSMISDPVLMQMYTEDVRSIVTNFEKLMTDFASQAFGLMTDVDLEIDNFRYGKSGPFGYFVRIKKGLYSPSQRVLEALYDESKWIRSREEGMIRSSLEQIVPQLHELLKSALLVYDTQLEKVQTAKAILKNLNLLKLLAEIESNVRSVIADENLMPISESTHILGKLIDGNETPFIYERIGTHYRNYMIDEFQDTSIAQWQNFRPLLTNSLAENNFNMVVGDVKQSIYRWRNGDWTILANKLERDFAHFEINRKSLDTNWRSKQAVVHFNNTLFYKFPRFVEMHRKNENPHLPEEFHKLISSAYQDVEQKTSPKIEEGSGYVFVEAIHSSDDARSEDLILSRLPELIVDIQDRGYKASDIAILVRRAIEGELVSNCLLKYKKESGDTKHCFDIISQDTLYIANSLSVRLIIGLLRACIDSGNEINNAFLNHYLHRKMLNINKPKETVQLDLFSSTNFPKESEKFSGLLPKNIISFLTDINQLSLPEIFEQLISTFELNKDTESISYIQELHDELLKFSKNKLSDVAAFLNWWELNSKKLKLSPGESTNGINILTIHKSKGLQFPIVIIPFCNWQMKPRVNNLMWVNPYSIPFNTLPKVPVNYSKNLSLSEFKLDYELETTQTLVDNINLMYVAFTRPEDELYIMLPLGKESDNPPASYIYNTATALYRFFNYKEEKTGEEFKYSFKFGKQTNKEKQKEIEAKNLLIHNYTSNNFIKKLRTRYESEDFFSENGILQQRNYGKLMHRVFAEIIHLEDIKESIDKLEDEGWIASDEVSILRGKIDLALKNPIVNEWFSGKMEVKTETFLLLPPAMQKKYGFSKRPDRVMFSEDKCIVVDYKFGVVEDQSHKKQVRTYTTLLESMGYQNVTAYLWYVDSNRVMQIN